MAIHNKKLIIFGGNSGLVEEILLLPLLKVYQKVLLISHRKYKGCQKINVLESIDPFSATEIVKKVMKSSNTKYDFIFSNTAPAGSNYNDHRTIEWSLSSLKLMNFLSSRDDVCKIILLGSSLSVFPFYHSSPYKNIKHIESSLFSLINLNSNKKACFIFLPPLQNSKSIAGYFFSEDKKKWALIILKELSSKNNYIYPNGILGLVTRFLFKLERKFI